MASYDVIIIGAGPNGMLAGAYLSQAGLKVLVLEKRLECGGGLATEEVTLPGFLHNTHAIYHMMVEYAPVYKDFKLAERYGIRHILPELVFAMPRQNGRSLCLYTDVNRSCDSIAQYSRRDADTYREVYHRFQRYMDEFLAAATYARPLSAIEQAANFEKSEIGREIMALSEKSPKTIVEELFENEHVRTMMLYLACHWGLEYDLEGLGYLAALYINRATNYRLCAGGSHMLFQALQKVLIENGGMIRGSQMIKRIVVEDGIARGVELEDGTTVEANKAVLSTVDPFQTFFKLVGKDNLDEFLVERLEDWRWDKWSLFTVHLALDQAPTFADPEIDNAFISIIGYDNYEDLINHWEAIYRGEIPDNAGFNCCFPSVHDPSQAPSGRYTGLISMMAPYRLKEGAEKWYSYRFKEELADKCLATLDKYCPGIKDKTLWKSVGTPIDTENKFLDMKEGSIKQGAYFPLQMGYLRPNEELSHNRTPIKNLYIGGASCHPGGCVLHGAGYVAANTIVEDLGIEKWWSEPEIVTRARERGLL
jgi:phytoene dehydrogenase-like protein